MGHVVGGDWFSGSLGESDVAQVLEDDVPALRLAFSCKAHLSVADGIVGELAHVFDQFLAVEGTADEAHRGVLGDGVVEGVDGTFEHAAVIFDEGGRSLEGGPLDLVERAEWAETYRARRYWR